MPSASPEATVRQTQLIARIKTDDDPQSVAADCRDLHHQNHPRKT